MRDEHVLEVRLRRVRVVPDEDNDDHPKDICRVRGEEAEAKKRPYPLCHFLILGQDERDKRGCENPERVDTGTCGRYDDRHLNREMLRHEGQPRRRRSNDRVHRIRNAEEGQDRARLWCERRPGIQIDGSFEVADSVTVCPASSAGPAEMFAMVTSCAPESSATD